MKYLTRTSLLVFVLIFISACHKKTSPSLTNAPVQVYTKDVAIAKLVFTNNGGGKLTSCSADSLPAGLSVAKSANAKTCEITGTPTVIQVATTHTITATNANGKNTAKVSMEVKAPILALPLPSLTNAPAQVYTKDVAIAKLVFTNNGGGKLTSCSADSLPAGLSVAKSANAKTCEITGTPTVIQVTTTHTITATNVSGENTAKVSMEVKTGVVDVTAPKVISRVPDETPASRKDVDPNITISLTFNEAMSVQTFTSANFYLLRGRDTIPADISYDAKTYTVTLQPKEPLKFWNAYELIFDGELVTDTSGNKLQNIRSYRRLYFTTKKGSWQKGQQVTYKKNGFELNHTISGSPSLEMDENDNAIVTWSKTLGRNKNNIWAARYSSGTWEEDGATSIQSQSGAGTSPAHSDALAINPTGSAVDVWSDNGNAWANYFSGTQWGTPKNLGKGTTNNFTSHVAIDTNGNAIAVWEKIEEGDRSDTYVWGASYSVATDTWSAPYRVSKRYRNDSDRDKNISIGGNIFNPKVIFTSNNVSVVLWLHGGSLWGSVRGSAAKVIFPVRVVYDPVRNEESVYTYGYANTDVSIDKVGNVWVTAREMIDIKSTGNPTVHKRQGIVAKYTPGVGVDSPVVMGDFGAAPIIRSNDDTTLAIWMEGSEDGRSSFLKSRRYTSTNGWENLKVVQGLEHLDIFGSFQFALAASGNAMVIWEQTLKGSSSQVWASRYDNALDEWEAPKRVDTVLSIGQALYPDIVIDSTGNPLAVWSESKNGGNYILYYSNTFP